jgi:hypothetical protein
MLIGMGSRRRSASQAIDLPSDGGVNFERLFTVLASPFKSKIRLEAENAVLRHQLTVLLRRLRGHVRLTNNDRCFFVLLYRRFPSILQVLTIIRLETLMRWHRSGFRCY